MKPALKRIAAALALAALACAAAPPAEAQRRVSDRRDARRAGVRSVTIPVTLRLREPRPQTEVQSIEYLTVLEDGEEQEILSVRGGVRSPLSLAVLIQDDLSSSISSEIKLIAAFIRRLPPGTSVLVGYLSGGSLKVRQRFTTDLERAARSLRIPVSSPAVAPYNPYVQTVEALRRFEGLAQGRRAVLLISDGVDTSRGLDSSLPTQSVDLQRAINEAQRRAVAVFTVYSPTVTSTDGRSPLVNNGQGSLQRLATETGGRAYFQGFSAPVSISPFLRDISTLLPRLFALTYLSTHPDKGFHNIKIIADLPDGEVLYPTGYTR